MAVNKEKKVGKGSGIVNKLIELCGSHAKAYYVLWRYAPDLLPKKNIKTFEELADSYTAFKDSMTEEECSSWLVVDEKVQRAVKWILERLHQQKILELYDKFYKQALGGDVRSFEAFIKFSNGYFTDDSENEISALLRNAKFTEDDE